MAQYESYFTDFSGTMFRFYLDADGNGAVPSDLKNYLFNRYNIVKHEFIPSLQFTYAECARNLVNYVDGLHPNTRHSLNNLYVVGPAYKESHLTTIDYQAIISGSPYYVGNEHFNEREVEPLIDVMRREVKEETFLSLRGPVHNYDLCFLRDTYLPQINATIKLVIDYDDIDVYGSWAYQKGISDMTANEIADMEGRVSVYKRNHGFRNRFNRHKIALTVIGSLDMLYNFYGGDIGSVRPPPHREIRENDFGVVLLPLNFVYMVSKKLLTI
jgi:hypothetical protein